MTPLKNDLLLRAARGEHTERTPVWLMRQAGRILPEYRAVRSKLSGFKELVETPQLAAEVTLQPVDTLGVDAAILFSDILVVPEALGLPYEMHEGRGPRFERTIASATDVARLRQATPDAWHYVYEAIAIILKELDGRVPLIGFAGAPFTIFCYMVEGGGSKTFSKARRMLYSQPEVATALLDTITKATITYLQGQVKAGVHLLQLFDSWAGVLSPQQYQKFSLPYLARICSAIDLQVPVTLFAKGAPFSIADLAALRCSCIGVDWCTPPAAARNMAGPQKTLQGNLDPALLYGSGSTIVKNTTEMLRNFGPQRHIANLGHGVYPDTDPRAVKLFVETIKNFDHGHDA